MEGLILNHINIKLPVMNWLRLNQNCLFFQWLLFRKKQFTLTVWRYPYRTFKTKQKTISFLVQNGKSLHESCCKGISSTGLSFVVSFTKSSKINN